MKELKLIMLLVSMVFILSCDDIEEPFIEETNTECGDASLPVPIKQILIEEFTGHKCGYCPGGDQAIEQLKKLYCDHIIPVSIHAGVFANTNSSGKYTYDFRSDDGSAIDEYYNPTEFPSALINRKEHSGGLILEDTYWLTTVSELLEQEPVLDIDIQSVYNSGSRSLEVDIDVIFIEAMNDNLMLSVYFVEDSIVSWQKDYSLEIGQQDVEFYPHNHVLRDAINGAWGDEILNGQISANDVKSKSFEYIVNNEWVVDNSLIVAFVYRNESKEVLQASQKYIID